MLAVRCEADFPVFHSAIPTYPTDNNNGEAKPAGEIISEWSRFFFPFLLKYLYLNPTANKLFGLCRLRVQRSRYRGQLLQTAPSDQDLHLQTGLRRRPL